jgi:hypothetical protein
MFEHGMPVPGDPERSSGTQHTLVDYLDLWSYDGTLDRSHVAAPARSAWLITLASPSIPKTAIHCRLLFGDPSQPSYAELQISLN